MISKFYSHIIAVLVSILLTLSLFYLLALTADAGNEKIINSESLDNFNLFMAKVDESTQVRKRERPPEPKLLKPQTLQTLSAQSSEQVSPELPNMDIELSHLASEQNIAFSPKFSRVNALSDAMVFNPMPTILSQVPPYYPPHAQRKKIEGKVTIQFIVTAKGEVDESSIKIISSTPEGVFDAAVIHAIMRWRFHPLVIDGQAVDSLTEQELEFSLDP